MTDLLPYPWQLDIWQHLTAQAVNNRLPHALLIQGEKGIGKKRLADSLAHYLLCKNPADFACGQCKTCLLLTAGTHPDFVKVGLEEKSKQIKVDQIRKVVDFVSKTSQMLGKKIIVIEPAEVMNVNAANALLKSLEEPTSETFIMLVSHAPKRLLPTIKSRCQTIQLFKPELQDSDKWLATFIQDLQLRQQLLEVAAGNPLLAIDYYERDLLDLYKQLLDQRISYKIGTGDAVKYAGLLDKNSVHDVLLLQQKLLWQLIQAAMQVQPLDGHPFEVLKEVYSTVGFAARAYRLLEEIQSSHNEVMGTTNPNTLLLLESLEVRWQALLRARR